MARRITDRAIAALLLVAAMVLSMDMRGNEAQLHLDGVVIVKKMPLAGTRVIVVDRDGPSTIISESVGHFTLPLSLDRTYLLSFEREGCVTKQLLFDTRVPGRYMGDAPFSFPFQVTLEPPPTSAPFNYAGPVGFVRFQENIHDFGYDVDYRITRDQALAERLDRIRQEGSGPASVVPGPKAARLPAPVADPDAPRGAFEELAPTLSDVPPLVHNTGTDPVVVPKAADPVMVVEPVAPVEVERDPVPEAPRASASSPAPSATAMVEPVIDGVERQEQLIVEPLRVTTIIRLTQKGHTTEYRRVAHAYGAVFFFRNGGSCSERTFESVRAH
ncbi:MAG: hypothetical protein QM724_07545 [Flavobacteriales bacterium]